MSCLTHLELLEKGGSFGQTYIWDLSLKSRSHTRLLPCVFLSIGWRELHFPPASHLHPRNRVISHTVTRWEQGAVWLIFAVTKATWFCRGEDREDEPDSFLSEWRAELFICFCSTKDYLRPFFPILTLCKSYFMFKENLSQDCNHSINRPLQGLPESAFTEKSHTQHVYKEPFNQLTKCIKHLKTLALSPQESTAKCMATLKLLAVLEIVPAEQIRSEWVGENRLFSKFGT